MDKNKLVSSVIIAVSLIVSSLILSHRLNKLGDEIRDAGIYSGNAGKLRNAHNRPLRIILVDDSEAQLIRKDKDPNE